MPPLVAMLRVDCRCAQPEPHAPPVEPLARTFGRDFDGRTASSSPRTPEEGLPKLLQRFCVGRFGCSTTMAAAPPSHPVARSVSSVGTGTSVAWCLTGNVRSFFSPLVHGSILEKGFRALGGVSGGSRVFFAVGLEDERKPQEHGFVLSVSERAGAAARPWSCTRLYRNLSHFLQLHPEWRRVTASVRELTARHPPSARPNPRCHLTNVEQARPLHLRDLSQMARWAKAMGDVESFERSAARRFDFVARLRPDVAFGAPLDPTVLLARATTAHMAWPVRALLRQRLLPTQDHFWIVPRTYAPGPMGILDAYARCEGDSFERLLGLNKSTGPFRSLCCGGGPTGVAVHAMQRAAHIVGGWSTRAQSTTVAGSDAPPPLAPLTVVNLELPLFIVGKPHREYCARGESGKVVTTYGGYFASASECMAVMRACDLPPEAMAELLPLRNGFSAAAKAFDQRFPRRDVA